MCSKRFGIPLLRHGSHLGYRGFSARRLSAGWLSGLLWVSLALAAFSYNDYLTALSKQESSGHNTVVNGYGYLGLYQMGEAALTDAGYYKADNTPSTNDWKGTWTGKNGINSKAEFLANPATQTQAITDYNHVQWGYIVHLGLAPYVGQTIGGIVMTESGMLAGAHLVGAGGLKKFLESNGKIVPGDANKVAVTNYISLFNGYDIQAITGHTTTSGLGNVPLPPNSTPEPIGNLGSDPGLGVAYQYFSVSPSNAFQSGASGVTMSTLLETIRLVASMLLLLWMAYVAWGQFRLWSTGAQSLYVMHSNIVKCTVMVMLLFIVFLT